ncbi:MAG: cation transporter [Firmicutes bacterium]|nr:cation diffusion facilitator family transporter [Bacillota bacterium]NLL87873.1 cation transporter [Bacillota bacterium]HKM16603.1 cation diffusion facilitator family transporter [Limnochordia bacterium]
MIHFLIRMFITNYEDAADPRVREAYGILSGVLGIICNVFLFVLKLGVGLAINSIAVLSDAFNNLTDLSSSLIVIVGAKLSSQPPDLEHPHGHGRYEYVGALVMAVIIIVVGLQLARTSIGKIVQPEVVEASALTFFLLVISVAVKLWMFAYNRYISGVINSGINRAAAVDSFNDAVATSSVVVGLVVGRYVSLPVDGIMGLLISLVVIYSGLATGKPAVSLLLGATPNPDLIAGINAIFQASPMVLGTHDLKLHDYGPGRIVGSIHAAVPADANVSEIHDELDRLERQVQAELGINMVIHADPEGQS